MIDILTLALTHGLMAWAAWRLVLRDELDEETTADRPGSRWLRQPPSPPADSES